MEHITQPLTPKRLRQFGLMTGGILVGLFGVTFPFLMEKAWPTWPWIIACTLWCVALIQPRWLKQVYLNWMKLGNVLGKINTFILLTIIYTFLFAPIGLITRLLKRDPLAYQLDKRAKSYRIVSEQRDKAHLERPF